MLNIGTQLQGCGCMTVDKQIIRLHSPTNLRVTNFANSTHSIKFKKIMDKP